MRCLYCHNPDTWGVNGVNIEIAKTNSAETNVSQSLPRPAGEGWGEGAIRKFTPGQILEQYESVKEFCKGGITVTGGEPMLQIEFVTELFKLAKEKNIHTALDTSGIMFHGESEQINTLLEYTDLVLLDIKHIDDKEHKKLTGHSNKNILEFAKYLSEKAKPMWIRHVVVPGVNDKEAYLKKLGEFIGSLKNVKALDVLPYHDMAIPKYENLGIEYPLKGVPPLTKEQAVEARNTIIASIKKSRGIL
jgi:pyruvate formate lyase activating enzyme